MARPRRLGPGELYSSAEDQSLGQRGLRTGLIGTALGLPVGGIFKARADENFDASKVLDSPALPYKKAGFFRQLLGDPSNRLNAEFQEARTALLGDKALGDYERQKEFEMRDKQARTEHELAMDREMFRLGQASVDAISDAAMQDQMQRSNAEMQDQMLRGRIGLEHQNRLAELAKGNELAQGTALSNMLLRQGFDPSDAEMVPTALSEIRDTIKRTQERENMTPLFSFPGTGGAALMPGGAWNIFEPGQEGGLSPNGLTPAVPARVRTINPPKPLDPIGLGLYRKSLEEAEREATSKTPPIVQPSATTTTKVVRGPARKASDEEMSAIRLEQAVKEGKVNPNLLSPIFGLSSPVLPFQMENPLLRRRTR